MTMRRAPARLAEADPTTQPPKPVIVPSDQEDPAAWEQFTLAVQAEARIRRELPQLLADLADAGEGARALNLLCAWGHNERLPADIWKELRDGPS